MDTSFNILASYAYLATNKKFLDIVMAPARAGEINLMIDSGAFTAHNSKSNTEHINVDSYCDFLDIYGSYCEKYVMLDVILNEQASKRNYETMVARGLKPMFVVTAKDQDFSYVKDTLNINENICVAGGVTEPVNWCNARYQNVFYKTGERAKIHGLGFVKFPSMFKVPIRSVDSSSWEVASKVWKRDFLEQWPKASIVARGSKKRRQNTRFCKADNGPTFNNACNIPARKVSSRRQFNRYVLIDLCLCPISEICKTLRKAIISCSLQRNANETAALYQREL